MQTIQTAGTEMHELNGDVFGLGALWPQSVAEESNSGATLSN